ncbi:ATP-dependent helicase [Longilinea arvoryzae]|nr:UvrD-helicase domain-containing protein [Longilinea arvoryzae]
MDYLNLLNPQQRQAVTAAPGQTLVLAGPGSGKTRVLTQRIAYLIQSMGVRPYNILAVTFTNKAAREMGERLDQLLGGARARGLWLGTFHAMCARILRTEANNPGLLPFQSNFVIFDADDQQNLVKRALRENNIDDKINKPSAIHARISEAKNNLVSPDDLPVRSYRDEIVVKAFKRYNELLQQNNAVDFDDLLLWVVRLFEEHPEITEKYARRFEYVLVDEFQDTNMVQYSLLKLISSYHHNIFVVGDEDQSIYRWRGADYRNMLRFEQDNPGCEKILLEQNYRSTQTVLDAARSVIDQNANRTPKSLFSDRGRGEKISLHEAVDDHAEAAYVVDTIQGLLRKGALGGDFAVMYRTNAQSRLLEEAFLRAGLAYRLVGAQRFYGRREVKDMIAFLRLVHNPDDEISLQRIIAVPPRSIGEKTVNALQFAAQKAGHSMGAMLLELAEKADESPVWKELGRGAGPIFDFAVLFSGWLKAKGELDLPALFDRIVTETDYKPYIDDGTDEGKDRWDNVEELRRLAFEYQNKGLVDFLENLALVSDQDTLPEQVNSPTLLTLHAAKGLEFPQVFIVGLDDGILPHSRSRDDPEEMAEERRLFYVGITRAKDHLYLVRAGLRSTYGNPEYQVASQFLDDIPEDLLVRSGGEVVGGPARLKSWDDTGEDDYSYGRRSSSHYSNSRSNDVSRSNSSSNDVSRSSVSRSSGSRSSNGWGKTSYDWSQPRTVHAASGRSTPPPPAPEPEQKFHDGQRVRHPSWGEGLVLSSRILDGEETLDVAFESVGIKRLIASLAKLEAIGN